MPESRRTADTAFLRFAPPGGAAGAAFSSPPATLRFLVEGGGVEGAGVAGGARVRGLLPAFVGKASVKASSPGVFAITLRFLLVDGGTM